MEKYVLAAYNDGVFYGYLAKHPDSDKLTYYTNNIQNAIKFDSYSDAEDKIDFVQNGSTLDAVIVKYVDTVDKNTIWTVDRNTPDDGEQGTTVYVVSTQEEALKRARYLNGKFGFGVDFTKEYDFDESINDDEYLYYDIGGFYIDEPFSFD